MEDLQQGTGPEEIGSNVKQLLTKTEVTFQGRGFAIEAGHRIEGIPVSFTIIPEMFESEGNDNFLFLGKLSPNGEVELSQGKPENLEFFLENYS